MIDWTSMLTALGTTAVVAAAVAWLLRALITQWLARNIEAYKVNLSGEAARELERLRHDLAWIAKEHETTFAQLHTKRSEVVAGLYAALIESEEAVENFIDPRRRSTDTDASAMYAAAFAALRALYQYFRRHRIYFSLDLCLSIETLFQALHEPAFRTAYFSVVPAERQDVVTDEVTTRRKEWTVFREAVPPVMTKIEIEFRRLLGVDEQFAQSSSARQTTRLRGLLEPEKTLERLLRTDTDAPVG